MTEIGIRGHIDAIAHHMRELSALMADAAMVPFPDVVDKFADLEQAWNLKPAVDAAFAWAAELHEAGRRVGGHRPIDFLTTHLDISPHEARTRLNRGRDLYDPPPAPESNSEEELRQHEKATRARQESRGCADVSEEKRRFIELELKGLLDDKLCDEYRAAGLREAQTRGPEDLRHWLRHEITKANRKTPGNPERAYANRNFWISKQDKDGGARVGGYLPAEIASVIQSQLTPAKLDADARANGVDPKQDTRTLGNRRADRLLNIFSMVAQAPIQKTAGSSSVVVSMTIDDIADMDTHSLFPTNVGVDLNPAELHRLGPALTDFLVLHDKQGSPLAVGRGRRSATLEQRIALFASELVCQYYGCSAPAGECDAHHVQPWSKGGGTDIDNLTLLCPPDHQRNNDKRDGTGNMGHAEKDPGTGRTGWRDPGADRLKHNDSVAAQKSAGHKIRSKHHPPTP